MNKRSEIDKTYPCQFCKWLDPARVARLKAGNAKLACTRPEGAVCMREQSKRTFSAAQSVNYSFSTNQIL